jgi:hypothetical protein
VCPRVNEGRGMVRNAGLGIPQPLLPHKRRHTAEVVRPGAYGPAGVPEQNAADYEQDLLGNQRSLPERTESGVTRRGGSREVASQLRPLEKSRW